MTAVAIVAALAAAAVALSPHLTGAAHVRFSAHMLQHMLLAGVSAPLLALAIHRIAVIRRTPKIWRRAVARWAGRPGLRDRGRCGDHRDDLQAARSGDVAQPDPALRLGRHRDLAPLRQSPATPLARPHRSGG